MSEDRLATVLRRAADTLTGLAYQAWHFGDSVAFEGMVAASEATGEERYAAFAHGFVRAWEARRDGHRPLDCTAPGLAMCRLYRRTNDPHLLTAAVRLADYLTSERRTVRGVYQTWEHAPLRHPYGPVPLPPEEATLVADPGPGVFVDCLHFDPPLLTALGELTGDERWTEAGITQAIGYVDLLQDPATGLFSHFYLERTDRTYVPSWGRGQGWALLGLLDAITHAPPRFADAVSRLSEAAARLCAAMRATQRTDGHWYAVVDEPRSGLETSTAAFMALGFRRAARLGIVPAAEYAEPAGRALDAALREVDDNGVFTGVSAAVWACTSATHYWYVPRGFVVPWGQGPLVLAAADALMTNEAR